MVDLIDVPRGYNVTWLRAPRSVAVLGAGVIGLAVARELTRRYPDMAVTVVEKERRVAAHQSGHNSGVVHAGVYYPPGSLKASLCRRGAGLLREFCEEHALPFRVLGKLIVATSDAEVKGLGRLEERARRNGVPGIRMMKSEEITEIEPEARGAAALYSPSTAAVDFAAVCRALADDIVRHGGEIALGREVTAVTEHSDGVEVTDSVRRQTFDRVIVCAGLHGDAFAGMSGRLSDIRIIPFRGEYYALRPEASRRVRGMIYPVPDPRYPFLGIHLTRDVYDEVHVGPNAVLALALEGYRRRDVDLSDLVRLASWPGTWRLAAAHWRHGTSELASSLFKHRYLAAVRRYLPDLEPADLVRATAGVRAQAVDRSGQLVDDFVLQDAGRVFLVRNAPSPAATSSLAIAEHIVSALSGMPTSAR